MFQFPSSFLISEVIGEFLKMLTPEKVGGATYYALYLPAPQGQTFGEWLRGDLDLLTYEKKINKVAVLYKSTTRSLKVKVPDGSVSTLSIDSRLQVREIVRVICEKLRVLYPDEYGLVGRSLASKSQDKLEISFESVSNERSK